MRHSVSMVAAILFIVTVSAAAGLASERPSVVVLPRGGYLYGSHTISAADDSGHLRSTTDGHGWHMGGELRFLLSKSWTLDLELKYGSLKKADLTMSGEGNGIIIVSNDDAKFSQETFEFAFVPVGYYPAFGESVAHLYGGVGLGFRNQFGGTFSGGGGSAKDNLFDFWALDLVSKLGVLFENNGFAFDLGLRTGYSMVPISWAKSEFGKSDPDLSSLNLTVSMAIGFAF